MPLTSTRTILLSLVVILASFTADAKLLPGYYITLHGDTITCKVEYNNWQLNPNKIAVDVNGTKQTFNATEIKGFGAIGFDDYRSATITFHKGPISGTDLPQQFTDTVTTKTVFLKVLESGFYSLFELNIGERPYYFVSGNDGAITELIYRVKQSENIVIEDPQYKKTLYMLFEKEGLANANSGRIEHVFYSSSELNPLVVKLNTNHTQIKQAPSKDLKNKMQLDLFAGGLLATFSSSFKGKYSGPDKFDHSFSPTGGINLFYRLPAHFHAVAIGLSVQYYHYSLSLDRSGTAVYYQSANYNSTTQYRESIIMANSCLLGDLYLTYVLNPLSKTRFFLKAGISSSVSLKQDRNINSTYTDTTVNVLNGITNPPGAGTGTKTIMAINNGTYAFNVGFGASVDRHKLELGYYLPANLISGNGRFNRSLWSLNYYFSIFR